MIRIVEVGPRDGLQNESRTIPTEIKVAYIDALTAAGPYEIEVSSFVSPKWIPQLADAEEVFKKIKRSEHVVYSALVPNERGLDRALTTGLDKVSVLTAASETFNSKNINTTIDGSFERLKPVVKRARDEGLLVRGYVSTAFWCPYEGRIEPTQVLSVVQRLIALGLEDISLGATIGKATVREVEQLIDVLEPVVGLKPLAMHFHDTFGTAVRNVEVSYKRGIRIFDSSAGGIGGCPYAPSARGNIGTSELVAALEAAGADLSVDKEKLADASAIITRQLREFEDQNA